MNNLKKEAAVKRFEPLNGRNLEELVSIIAAEKKESGELKFTQEEAVEVAEAVKATQKSGPAAEAGMIEPRKRPDETTETNETEESETPEEKPAPKLEPKPRSHQAIHKYLVFRMEAVVGSVFSIEKGQRIEVIKGYRPKEEKPLRTSHVPERNAAAMNDHVQESKEYWFREDDPRLQLEGKKRGFVTIQEVLGVAEDE